VPVDPRDLFRGDYVTLRYEITAITSQYWRDGLSKITYDITYNNHIEGKKIYVVLKVDANDVADVLYASDKKPQKGELYIRGRINYLESGGSLLYVKYGIEAYFVEQGKGQQLEQRGSNAPLREAEIALGRNGIAVIKGFRQPAQ
jgi:uncharacterized membrane-anchored protein